VFSIFSAFATIESFLIILVSASLLVRVPIARHRVLPQHRAVEISLTYNGKFPILTAQKSELLTMNTISISNRYIQVHVHPHSVKQNVLQKAKDQGLHCLGGPLDDGGIGVLLDTLRDVTNQ
jgi:hypothetical protein